MGGDSGFRYTSAPERRERLVKYITEQGYCTTAELSGIFGVSEMTIRRDVSKLVESGEVRGLRGGVGSLTHDIDQAAITTLANLKIRHSQARDRAGCTRYFRRELGHRYRRGNDRGPPGVHPAERPHAVRHHSLVARRVEPGE